MRILLASLLPITLFAQRPVYDSLTKELAPKLYAAGASVLIIEKGNVLLNKGYGYAHIGFKVAATPDTKYFMIVPGTIMLSASVLQQVEQGKLALDDDIKKYVPGFSTHGKKITVRHLLSSTSGIPDLHYLGDPYDGLRSMPRSLDEVVDMFTGLPLTIEPGEKWDWSISNYALLATILQKVTSLTFEEYASANFIKPLGLTNTEYLKQHTLISNLAEPYALMNAQFYRPGESLMKYDPSLRFVTTTGDVYKLWRGLADGKLISAKSFALMTGEEEMKNNRSGNFGYGIQLVKDSLSKYLTRGGALEGYSNYLYYNPKEDLTIIVLTNTGNQSAREIGRRLAAFASGIPVPPVQQRLKKELANEPVEEEEMKQMSGTYVLSRKLAGTGPLTQNLYKRTVRVFVENGQLMIQFFGDLPVALKKQPNGVFIPEGQGSPYSFKMDGDKMRMTVNAAAQESITSGLKLGNADARSFRTIAFQNVLPQ